MKKESKTKEVKAVKADDVKATASEEKKKSVAKAPKAKAAKETATAAKASKATKAPKAVKETKTVDALEVEEKPAKAIKETKAKAKSAKVVAKNSEYPAGLYFTKRHIWALPNTEDNTALVGISDFLADELGNIDGIDVPSVGDEVEMESICIHIHVSNHVRAFRCPLTGRVVEVNQDVIDDPTQIYMDYYGSWLFKMEFDDPAELDILMDGAQYSKYLDEL